ncbi:MAG: BrnT family toxin [Acidobacteria bacterium]|nr:BrnT family toxin [Acidobacteriota bacterium]
MRIEFDQSKSRIVKQKHGISLKEAQSIFDQAFLLDQKCDDPRQFRAIGWCGGRLCSVILEVRRDSEGEYWHLITAWKATKEEEQSYAENV